MQLNAIIEKLENGLLENGVSKEVTAKVIY